MIESIESSDEDLHDWNDALEYLTDAQNKGTADEAKAALVRALQKKQACNLAGGLSGVGYRC